MERRSVPSNSRPNVGDTVAIRVDDPVIAVTGGETASREGLLKTLSNQGSLVGGRV